MSEIDSSTVVVVGTTALVGVTFASQYQGGVTDRITEMVTEKAKAAEESISEVVVTDAPDQVAKIQDLAQKVGENISEDVTQIVNQLKRAA